jgi:hypothetical protein
MPRNARQTSSERQSERQPGGPAGSRDTEKRRRSKLADAGELPEQGEGPADQDGAEDIQKGGQGTGQGRGANPGQRHH